MNVWNFTGNLGKDAEVKHLPSGDTVTEFSVAVKAGYGKNEKTIWAKCSYWNKRGEAVAPYLTKGQLVGISGELSINEYTNKDGENKVSLEVRVNDLTLLGKRDSEQSAPRDPAEPRATAAQPAAALASSFSDFEDDIPF